MIVCGSSLDQVKANVDACADERPLPQVRRCRAGLIIGGLETGRYNCFVGDALQEYLFTGAPVQLGRSGVKGGGG